MRLGDLDALKEAIENITLDKHTMIWITGLREALKYIDNAPTVEPYCYFCGQKEHGIRTQGDLNNAIKTIKAICKDNNTCNTCPMDSNCNYQPAIWKEAKGGAE